jgi:hypothetical protein
LHVKSVAHLLPLIFEKLLCQNISKMSRNIFSYVQQELLALTHLLGRFAPL